MYIYLRITTREDTLSYVDRWPKDVDKVTILKKSWASLQKSITPEDTILLFEDQCPQELIDWFEKTSNTFNIEIYNVPKHEPLDYIHYFMLLDKLDELTKSFPDEVHYIANDDYIYTTTAIKVLASIFADGWKGFAVPFDYPDRYSLDKQMTPLTSKLCEVFIGSSGHWRTVISCPGITSTLGSTWQQNMVILKQAGQFHSDSYTWQAYAKFGCVSPLPGVATHMTPHHLTPVINWEKIYNDTDI